MMHEISADLLCHISMDKTECTHKISCPKNKILEALEEHYNGKWAYVITNESILMENGTGIIYMMLYIPNHAPIAVRHEYELGEKNPEINGIRETLLSIGIIKETKINNDKEECVDFNKMTEEEYEKEIAKTAPITTPPISEMLEQDKKTIMDHVKNEPVVTNPQAPVAPPIIPQTQQQEQSGVKPFAPIQYPEIMAKIGVNEKVDDYLLRISKELENAFYVIHQQMPKSVFDEPVSINNSEVPSVVAACVQHYALNGVEQKKSGVAPGTSWISGAKIDVGKDITYGVTELDRNTWTHLTSEEIVLEKAINHYFNDVPVEIVPMVTRRALAKSFGLLDFPNETTEMIDKRLFIKLSILGFQPSMKNPFGILGSIGSSDDDTVPFTENGMPTPPKMMTFSNPPDPNCPPALTQPVTVGWNEDKTINTQIEKPDPLKYYVPPVNKIPFVQTGVNQQGVPINMYGYTELQMDRVQAFKEQFDADKDEVFDSYVKSWSNGNLQKKIDINPNNIDAFLTWVEGLKLGKALWQ